MHACILCQIRAQHAVISAVTSVLTVSLCLQAVKCDRICKILPASARLPQLLRSSLDQFPNYPHVCALFSVCIWPKFSFGSSVVFWFPTLFLFA